MDEEVRQVNDMVSAAEPSEAGVEADREATPPTGERTTARTLYFMPRRLGATAPHDCSNWSLDYRAGHDSQVQENEQPIRSLEDESLVPQLNLLLDAGRRIAL